MNLDDRLRSAQKQQLHLVQTEVRRRGLDTPPEPETRWPWFLSMGMAAAILVLIWQMAPRPGSETSITALSPTPTEDVSILEPTVSTTTTTRSTPTTTARSTAMEQTEEAAATSPSVTTSTGQSAVAVERESGVANDVCESGFRAQLERAKLRYVSADQGWDRMADLVNEQDGPYYFGLWEPDYEGVVSVEVQLDGAVHATAILLAQHPYKDVAGTITVETGGMVIPIELSGRDGVQTHRFEEPTLVESFVITRSEAASNITEVILCVAP